MMHLISVFVPFLTSAPTAFTSEIVVLFHKTITQFTVVVIFAALNLNHDHRIGRCDFKLQIYLLNTETGMLFSFSASLG